MATVAERLEIHPTTPQPRLLRAAASDEPVTRATVERLVAARDHQGRPLTELVCRYRHFRAQSQDVMSRFGEDAWRATVPDLDGRSSCRAEIIAAWVRDETAILDRLETAV